MPEMPSIDPALVRRFYDRSTPGFTRFGQGGPTGTIHRAVWGDGVTTRDQAFHFVEAQIAGHVRSPDSTGGTPHIVDLGCGVGGSVCYLAARLPVRATGVTLSPVQADHARIRIAREGLADRVRVQVADYCDLPPDLGPADLAYAIESFVHGPDPARFFTECQRLITPGGRLVICDDFRRPTDDPAAAAVLDRYRRGWHVHSLLTPEELHACAADAGFAHVSTLELTPHLELDRPRDLAIKAFVTLFDWLPLHRTMWGHLTGGDALQTALRRGWLKYDLVVFERQVDGTPPVILSSTSE